MPDDAPAASLPAPDNAQQRDLGSTILRSTDPPADTDATTPLSANHSLHNELPTVPGYEVTREIARGGMGRVLAARDLSLDRQVAIKVLLPGTPAGDLTRRFVVESKVTAQLPHPNVPPVYALGTLADGSPFLAMKLVAGRTMATLLRARTSSADDLPRFVQAFEQMCQAVGFAHSRGIIHRDLKPANVMVGEFGEVQVMDWGLARLSGEHRTAVNDPQGANAPHSDIEET